MNRVQALMVKEWQEAIKNKIVLFTGIFLPVLFVFIPLIMLYIATLPEAAQDFEDLPPGALDDPMFEGLEITEIIQVVMGGSMQAMFLTIPLAIPITIAAYSVVGEKQQRSLEALLATPISVLELLTGKALAAALPGMAAAWLSYGLYAAAARLIVVSDRAYAMLFSPAWLLAIVVAAPLLTVLAVTLGLIVSSRVNDPRAAEQLAMVVILPVVGLMISQITGLLRFSITVVLVMVVVVLLADVVMIYIASKVFARETILTRWH